MSLFLILALPGAAAAQAPPDPPQPTPPPIAAIDFDLAHYRAAGDGDGCLPAGGADVLVCGSRRGGRGAYPMDHWARIFGPEPPIRAEMGLGGNVTGRIHTEAVPMDRGAISKRALVGIRLPF